MKKSKPSRFPAAVVGAVLLLAAVPAGLAQGRDEVRGALVSGAYGKAIDLALDALRADPSDAEVRFLLARAYAYAGRRDEAEASLDRLLAEHPADADLLVFKARLLSWRRDLDGAERTFRRALELQPRSADALAGLADLAAWRGDRDGALVYARRALELDADHAQALFRTGSVLLWQGDYGRARGYLARAAELEPRNGDFARALAAAAPVFARRAEVWLDGRNEHWSDGRGDYTDLGVAGLFSVFRDRARLVVKAGRLWRAGRHDDRIGLEAYPQLWKGAYGYCDLSLAPKAAITASSSVHLEIYQSFLKRFEASLGARRMSFGGGHDGVTVLVSSAAIYAGPWYPNVRVSRAGLPGGSEITWTAGLRRYLAGASYLWAGAGRGARSLETGPAEEILLAPAWFAEAGFDLYVLRDIKLRGYLSFRKEAGGPSSTAASLVVGYRF
ncbi:MAG: YaiO family outer membrane beta-barrel protein [Acidobacteriota bacterium]